MLIKYLRALLSCFVTKKGSLSTVYGRELSNFTAPSGEHITLLEAVDGASKTYVGVAPADGWVTYQTNGGTNEGSRYIRINGNNKKIEFANSVVAPGNFYARAVCSLPVRKGQSFEAYRNKSTDADSFVWFTPIQ